jgi:hypothetical protein
MSRVVMVAVALLASACTTTKRDTVFDGSVPGGAMAVIVADGMPTGLATSEYFSFVFRRIDLDTSRFLTESFAISFEPFAAVVNRELKKPRDMNTSVRFGAVDTPAGDYALTSRIDGRYMGGTHHCYALGARVVRIESGRVNIVALGSVSGPTRVYPEVVEKQTRAVLAGYPAITAPLAHAADLGTLRFELERKILGKCEPQPKFSFVPAG